MESLHGQVAFVTGGAMGMGASHVRALNKAGARVVIADIAEDNGNELVAEIGDAALFVKLDVTSDSSWKAAVSTVERHFGAIDILVNNAGIFHSKPWLDTTTDEWKRVIDTDLVSMFIGIREVVPSMRKNGRGGVIINISSTAGFIGYSTGSAYCASKWAIRGLTKTAAVEFAGDNIRVNSVHPGPIATPLTKDFADVAFCNQAIARWGRPDEVSAMVLFLATAGTFCTGSEFIVDGGCLLGDTKDSHGAR